MDKSELQRAEAWLEERWQDRPCPVCASKTWSGGARLGQIENLDSAGRRIPVFYVSCTTCGYTALVHAIYGGIRKPDPETLVSGPGDEDESSS